MLLTVDRKCPSCSSLQLLHPRPYLYCGASLSMGGPEYHCETLPGEVAWIVIARSPSKKLEVEKGGGGPKSCVR